MPLQTAGPEARHRRKSPRHSQEKSAMGQDSGFPSRDPRDDREMSCPGRPIACHPASRLPSGVFDPDGASVRLDAGVAPERRAKTSLSSCWTNDNAIKLTWQYETKVAKADSWCPVSATRSRRRRPASPAGSLPVPAWPSLWKDSPSGSGRSGRRLPKDKRLP